ncbi:MAG: MFS transporter [Nocardioidaceae bacterium]|nr:MFS transporter [Nocardioidaceae bacterium]
MADTAPHDVDAAAATQGANPGYLLNRRATMSAFTSLVLGIFLATLAQTILVTALPHIVADLNDPKEYSWIFGVYMLTSTVTVPLFGRLSDLHGRRRYFLAGVVVFMAGAVIGAFADTMGQVITARAVQGLGAGAVIPVAQAAIGDLVPPSRRGRWQSGIGGVIALAYVVGPTVGGWLADNVDWRWTFTVTLPVGVLTFATGWRSLRFTQPKQASQPMNYVGSLLMAGGLSGVLIGVVELGQGAGPLSAGFLGPTLVGAILLAALVHHQRATTNPVIPAEFVGDRLFVMSCAGGFVTGVALFAAIVYTPLLTQGVLGISATSSGIALAPLMIANFTSITVTGDIITRTGRYRPVILAGAPIMATGFALLALVNEQSSIWLVVTATIVIGLGLGCLQQNLVLVMQNALPAEHTGIVTSASQFTRTAGGAVGIAILGAVLSWLMGSSGVPQGEAAASAAQRAALAGALRPLFVVTVVVMAIGCWAVARIPQVALRKTVHQPEAEEQSAA